MGGVARHTPNSARVVNNGHHNGLRRHQNGHHNAQRHHHTDPAPATDHGAKPDTTIETPVRPLSLGSGLQGPEPIRRPEQLPGQQQMRGPWPSIEPQ